MLDYCSLIWGNCNKGQEQILIKLQKAAARIIMNATFNDRSDDMFRNLKWKTFPNKLREKRLIMIYKSLHNEAPSYITDMFTPVECVHGHSLRSTTAGDLYIHGGKTEYHMKRFSYLAAKEWNQLTQTSKNAKSLYSFKRLIQH